MTSVENHLSSYEVGKKPFRPDVNRGKWNSKYEFYLTCIGHAFGIHTLPVLAVYVFNAGGVFNLLIVSLSVFLFLMPIYLIQSTLGQFSSTGGITVFRLSPVFKGVGYITTLLNLLSASYFSIPAAYTLLYLYSSINYELPWLSCNHTWNTVNCSEIINVTYIYLSGDEQTSASEFYMELTQYEGRGSPFSWHIFTALILIWICVSLFVIRGVQMLGKIFWYTALIPLGILGIFVIRMFFSPAFGNIWSAFFAVDLMQIVDTLSIGPLLAVMMLGPGWNTVLTLASYNDFKADVEKAAYIIPSILFGLTFLSGLVVMSVVAHVKLHVGVPKLFFDDDQMQFHFIVFTHFLGHLETPHLWSILYFLMLLLLELNSVAIQIFTVVTALYDEYDRLRPYKTYTNIGLCVFCGLFSTLYAFGDSIKIFLSLAYSSITIKIIVCFLELMIYVWFYGRIRFLRDLSFVLGRDFSSWKFYIIRFITPILTLLALFYGFLYATAYSHLGTHIAVFLVKLFSLLFIPGYILYRLSTTTGSFLTRFKKCLQPTDWYPVEQEHRNAYEAMLGLSDTSHQLVATDSCNE